VCVCVCVRVCACVCITELEDKLGAKEASESMDKPSSWLHEKQQVQYKVCTLKYVCAPCVNVFSCVCIVYGQVQLQAGCARNCKGNAKARRVEREKGRAGEGERESGRGRDQREREAARAM
jgi:hypothetical protein